MPRNARYVETVVPLERKHFTNVGEAINYFNDLGYSVCEFDTRTTSDGEEIRVMVSKRNPRDYVEIIKTRFRDVNTVRHIS